MIVTSVIIFFIAVVMGMTGRGGGNFYVPVMVASGLAMHDAAMFAQCVLFCTAVATMLVFHNNRIIDWKLALLLDPPTDIMAFVGGYFSHYLAGSALKIIFSFLLVIAGFFMLYSFKEVDSDNRKRFGFWYREFGGYCYTVNLWLSIPITALTGLVAGMVGVSGGSFKIPLMVITCGVPMRIAIGTSSAMVAVTALMGALGHITVSRFNMQLGVSILIAAVLGGLIGGKLSLKTKPDNLKIIFAITTLVAALFMGVHAIFS